MCGQSCARFILIVFNTIFFLSGALLLGVGVWAKVDPNIAKYLDHLNLDASAPLVQHAAYLLIGVGALTFIVGFIGCCGAIRVHPGLLFVYATCLLIIMALEVAIAVIALIHRNKIDAGLKEQMMDQVKNKYGVEDKITTGWDNLQKGMKCCGADSHKDYVGSAFWNKTQTRTGQRVNNTWVPNSCCNQAADNWRVSCMMEARTELQEYKVLYTNGCHLSLKAWFKQHSLILMIVAFAIGGMQLLGFIAACALRRAKRDEGDYSRHEA